jgi:hypothetical protein
MLGYIKSATNLDMCSTISVDISPERAPLLTLLRDKGFTLTVNLRTD